jgi:hypothetical protein
MTLPADENLKMLEENGDDQGNSSGKIDHEDHETEFQLHIAFIVMFVMLFLYIVIGSFMEKLHLPVCHETGVMILIGIAVSFLLSL